ARSEDQAQQFDLGRPPLMRVMLFALRNAGEGGAKVHVIWTHHHLLMDGWCVGILVDHLLSCCAPGKGGLSPQPSLNEGYFRWLASRDRSSAHSYWSTLLAGIEQATRLPRWPQQQGRNSGYQ